MMTRQMMAKTLLAVMLGTSVPASVAFANSTTDSMQSAADSAGQKIDSSMNKVGKFMDDSSITAKVKAALVDNKAIKSTDISVTTENKVVTLSGTVESQTQADEAANAAKRVEGVTSVINALQVK